MNNNASWFPATEAGQGNNLPLNTIRWAVDHGEDPIDFWREHQMVGDREMTPEDMADILACDPHVYQLHLASRHSDPYSPLNGNHVLNFCRHVGVHPADLVSDDLNPRNSIPPHIYAALEIVAQTSGNREDRALAHVHIGLEKKRFGAFVQDNPDVAEYFLNMRKHVQTFNADESWHKQMQRSLKAMENPDLRRTLRRSFAREQVAYDFYDAKNHAEDFHLVQRSTLQANEHRLQYKQGTNHTNAGVVWSNAARLYGIKNADHVLEFLNRKISEFDERNYSGQTSIKRLTALMKDLYPLAQGRAETLQERFASSAGMNDPIGMLCTTAYVHARQQKEVPPAVTRLRSDVQELNAFEEWQRSTQQPEFFYMNYLYCNDVAARKAAQPAKVVEQPQLARL